MRTVALSSHDPLRTSAHDAARDAARVGARPHPLRTRHHIVAPSLRIPDAAAASVFAAVRQRGGQSGIS